MVTSELPDRVKGRHKTLKTHKNGFWRDSRRCTMRPLSRNKTPKKIAPSNTSLLDAEVVILERILTGIEQHSREERVDPAEKNVSKNFVREQSKTPTECRDKCNVTRFSSRVIADEKMILIFGQTACRTVWAFTRAATMN